ITTKLDDSQNMIWASNAKAEYTNVATLSSAGNKDVSDDAKQEFVSEVIKKTAGDYNYNTHIIPYTITVNQNKMPMGKVIVKDPLDSRLEYVDGSSNVTDTVYDASKNTLTFTFDNLDDTQVITFNAKVKDGDTFLNNGEFTIENNASLVSDKYDKETKVLANTKIKNTVIAKKGSRNKEVINYTVELNVANQDLYRGGVEEVVIEDKIGASLVLDEDSVKLFEATVSADGKLTKATLVDTAEKRFDYSTPKTIMQVVVPKSGANKAYILEYTAKMLKAKANDFSNNVVLKGYGDNSKNTSDVEYQEKDFTDVDFSKYVYYISGLKDENNHTIDISGAHFELRDPSRGDRLIDEADTDENGELMFVGALEENHEYLLKETYVPDGYVIPDNLKDGVLVYTKGKGYAVALKEKDNNIVYNSKPSREVDFSLLDNRDKKTDLTKATEKPGKITVYNGTKEVWNSDSTTPFKAVYGIEYTVKESSDPYGYNGDSDTGYKFVIDEATQKLTLKTTSSNVSLSGDKITMYDSKKPSIDIKVNDVSESIGKSLKGAKFVLKKGTENFKTWESDGDLKEVTLFEGDYTLSRTDAPLGFLKESKVLKFSVKKNALGELEIETTENNDSLEITGNKIVVPEKTDATQEVTVDTSTPRRGSVDLSKLTGLSLLPVTYTDGKETGVSDTPVWSETDGTPLKLQPQVEYVLSATDENGKKVLYKMVVDESGNLKTETYVAPRKSTSARPSSSNSSSHSGSSSNSSSSNSAPANTDKTVTANTTNGNRTLAKTSGFIGTVVGYAVGVLMIVGGILMISVRRKKNK
ncbi:MAG: hypothetical protein IK068_01695, partial [Lachnospiraceae bacterium]|nr:hypothetical protein [Lachnospiraceae bacterium]